MQGRRLAGAKSPWFGLSVDARRAIHQGRGGLSAHRDGGTASRSTLPDHVTFEGSLTNDAPQFQSRFHQAVVWMEPDAIQEPAVVHSAKETDYTAESLCKNSR